MTPFDFTIPAALAALIGGGYCLVQSWGGMAMAAISEWRLKKDAAPLQPNTRARLTTEKDRAILQAWAWLAGGTALVFASGLVLGLGV